MHTMEDRFNLGRFVSAQAAVYPQVLSELRTGEKRSHWIWFIFPQMKGLGHSAQSEYYGIGSLEEAAAYLHHPLLGLRLIECTQVINSVQARPIERILGYPDDLKFRSSMTLFAHAATEPAIFNEALQKYCGGEPDLRTVELLG
jgi:uncharacterized protein (DUF1810 family)